MNRTSNYGFNVPVGADIVNPLVQDFPNWDSLDTILRNVANTGVVTATHTKSGTIHTLSFTDTTVPMIRFQATADFNTNDTFTVNGLSVSALTVSGEALPDGAFVIGSMVLCNLRDNLLTVYTSGTDAATLDGHPASYFATASDLQTVDDKADANKILIDQLTSDLSDCIDIVAAETKIGTFLGNNLYRKGYTITSPVHGNVITLESGLNPTNVVSVKGCMKVGNELVPVGECTANPSIYNTYCWVINGNVCFEYHWNNTQANSVDIIIEYTK